VVANVDKYFGKVVAHVARLSRFVLDGREWPFDVKYFGNMVAICARWSRIALWR
jgi:hypothetical protein